ncbi:site-specific DNA-methyltransferase [Exercitatus varius]|uniref:site-specific DNA-methyltransferase n=1 Tax=Exercitatus varius TaxID=67857 RepID=UPI00294B1327|nr:site-specific DNA-methyltransferase [Exercitatus varius]MDG2941858.1 site-specific DNA-methyltransferase [Exercitatus varius]
MLNWAGKSVAYQTLQTPTFKTLTPCVEESVDFEHTQNVFIEGENLDVLKVLQKSYFNSVKMIYIDPPYNTGNDFIYKDNFAESKAEYAERVGDLDADGKLKRAFVRNNKENGHYHSNWLNMMLPRLHLAKNLLTDDGVIFISIDDNEQAQLKLLCDEVFGEENFVAEMPWKGRGGGADDKNLLQNHEYILMYAKDKEQFATGRKIKTDEKFPKFDPEKERNYKTQLARKWGSNSRREDRPNLYYSVKMYDGTEIYPILPDGSDGRWRWKKERFEQALECKDIEFSQRDDGFWEAYEKIYEPQDGEFRTKLYAAWLQSELAEELEDLLDEDDCRNTAFGTKQVKSLFNDIKVFDYPKPTNLIKLLSKIGTVEQSDIILDFFGGSGTTAHTVMQLNAEDNGNRRFICVQLPEQTDEKSEAFKAGFKNIAEISKERIRRAGKQILQNNVENRPLASSLDTGFKVFKLTESHFKQWQSPTEENLADQLEMFIDPVSEQTDTQAVLYEILLRLGLKLTVKVRSENQVFWVEDENGQTFALMLTEINDEMIEKVIATQPKKVVTLDRLFNGNDAQKKNTELQMQDADIAFFVI